jgi:hypothetical protein
VLHARQVVCARFGQALHMEAVLLTGLFGVGKSTIAAEMADLLEDAGVPYAALDLDWLTWCNVGDGDRASEHAMLLRNLRSVMANYRAAGVGYFVLGRWIQDRDELAGLVATMAMPLHTVELAVPLDEITRRLATDPTAGRRENPCRVGRVGGEGRRRGLGRVHGPKRSSGWRGRRGHPSVAGLASAGKLVTAHRSADLALRRSVPPASLAARAGFGNGRVTHPITAEGVLRRRRLPGLNATARLVTVISSRHRLIGALVLAATGLSVGGCQKAVSVGAVNRCGADVEIQADSVSEVRAGGPPCAPVIETAWSTYRRTPRRSTSGCVRRATGRPDASTCR